MDNRPYRECVRVIIFHKDKILLGKKTLDDGLVTRIFPGGGIEDDDTQEETVKKECLEEVGILVKGITYLNLETKFDFVYDNPERAKKFRGGQDYWYAARFDKMDKSLFDVEGDKLPANWMSVEEAVELIKNEGGKEEYIDIKLKALKLAEDVMTPKEVVKESFKLFTLLPVNCNRLMAW